MITKAATPAREPKETEPTTYPESHTPERPEPIRPPHIRGINRRRLLVMAKTRFRCTYCGLDLLRDANTFSSMTLDHFWPKSKGGENCLRNLWPSCDICNQLKADYLPESLEDAQAFIAAKRSEFLGYFLEVADYHGIDIPKDRSTGPAFRPDMVIALGTFAGQGAEILKRLKTFETQAAAVLERFQADPVDGIFDDHPATADIFPDIPRPAAPEEPTPEPAKPEESAPTVAYISGADFGEPIDMDAARAVVALVFYGEHPEDDQADDWPQDAVERPAKLTASLTRQAEQMLLNGLPPEEIVWKLKLEPHVVKLIGDNLAGCYPTKPGPQPSHTRDEFKELATA